MEKTPISTEESDADEAENGEADEGRGAFAPKERIAVPTLQISI